MKRSLQLLGAALACVAAATTFVQASIESFTLETMLARVDNAVVGKIVDRHVFKATDPDDGTMYFTTITVEGNSLIDGKPMTLPVTYYGGWINEDEGSTTSVTPEPSETALGKQVVAFYIENDEMGYGVGGNQLFAMHGGLFQVVQRRSKVLALGKGTGFAIDANVEMTKLRTRTQKIVGDLQAQGKQFK